MHDMANGFGIDDAEYDKSVRWRSYVKTKSEEKRSASQTAEVSQRKKCHADAQSPLIAYHS